MDWWMNGLVDAQVALEPHRDAPTQLAGPATPRRELASARLPHKLTLDPGRALRSSDHVAYQSPTALGGTAMIAHAGGPILGRSRPLVLIRPKSEHYNLAAT
jgi:hypothetical protein